MDRADPRGIAALRFILKYHEKNGAPPTVRELAGHLGTVPSNALAILRRLERKKMIRRARRFRGIRVEKKNLPADIRPGDVRVPILGRVAAGHPALQEQTDEGTLAVDPALARGARCYGLKIQGDSMLRFDIHDGDIVVVRETATAEDGDIVVALVNGENTVKRLRLSKRGITLEPGNPRYKPIKTDAENLRIQGKVLLVQRFL